MTSAERTRMAKTVRSLRVEAEDIATAVKELVGPEADEIRENLSCMFGQLGLLDEDLKEPPAKA